MLVHKAWLERYDTGKTLPDLLARIRFLGKSRRMPDGAIIALDFQPPDRAKTEILPHCASEFPQPIDTRFTSVDSPHTEQLDLSSRPRVEKAFDAITPHRGGIGSPEHVHALLRLQHLAACALCGCAGDTISTLETHF